MSHKIVFVFCSIESGLYVLYTSNNYIYIYTKWENPTNLFVRNKFGTVHIHVHNQYVMQICACEMMKIIYVLLP